MCVLMSTVSMQAALLSSMNPMPPMSAARLNTYRLLVADLLAGIEAREIE